MRITHKLLLQNARQLVSDRRASDRSLLCAYLSGSFAACDDVEEALLGGAGDIDLVFVHNYIDRPYRELIPLTDALHYDIWHVTQSAYDDPKQLRGNPWIGHDLFSKPQVFYNHNHWFDFVLAGAFSKYNQPENVALRGIHFINRARQGLQTIAFHEQAHPDWLITYLNALSDSANALAILTGGPISMRRLVLEFPARAGALREPAWTGRLIEAFSRGVPAEEQLESWLVEWKRHFSQAPADGPVDLSPVRTRYYLNAMNDLRQNAPMAAVWILIYTFALYLSTVSAELSTGSPNPAPAYLETLGLAPQDMAERSQQLEKFVDDCEETLEQWATHLGLPSLAELTNS